MPNFIFEERAWRRGARFVAGVDEVGRGPWAGPVVAASVVLDMERCPDGLDDSKKLSAKRRGGLFELLRDCAQIGIGQASVEEIDRLNILQASFLAMRRAVDNLPRRPDHLLVDGRQIPAGMPCVCEPVIRGDGLSLSIAAASIMAKVTRDRLMVTLAQQHPQYGWETNMGYGVPKHLVGLKRHGVTPHHRRSFKPVHKILYQENL